MTLLHRDAVIARRGGRSQRDIAAAMRRMPGCRATDHTWVSMVERGILTDVPERIATALAAALDCGLSEIMAPDDSSLLAALCAEVAALRSALTEVAEHWGIRQPAPAGGDPDAVAGTRRVDPGERLASVSWLRRGVTGYPLDGGAGYGPEQP